MRIMMLITPRCLVRQEYHSFQLRGGSFEYPYQYKLRLSGAENPLDAKAVLDALSKGEDGISPQAHRIATRIASMATPDFMKEGPITQKTLLQNIDLSEDPLAAGQLQP
jgi:hypothetical protein